MKNIPEWLTPPPPPPILDRFEVIFELLLVSLREGTSLADFVNDYAKSDIADTHDHPITAGYLRGWIYRDKQRVKLFEEAMKLFTLALGDQNLRISDGKNPDGSPSMNDTGRSKLMVQTRRELMVAFNKEQFGAEPPPINAGFGANGITINMGTVVSPYTIENNSSQSIPLVELNTIEANECA
jgi:hypothetical protein